MTGIESLGTFHKITMGKYPALKEKGVPCAIPMMSMLTIKKVNYLLLLQAKSCIVVWATTSTEFGQRVIDMLLSFNAIHFVFLSVLWLKVLSTLSKGM
jgi:hypothetical protein